MFAVKDNEKKKILIVVDNFSDDEKKSLKLNLEKEANAEVYFSELTDTMTTKKLKVAQLDDALFQIALAIYIEAKQKKCDSIIVLCCEALQQALKDVAKRKNFIFHSQTTFELNKKFYKDDNSISNNN